MNNNLALPKEQSELIITNRGTIYHLDLAPENLAHTVITVGDPGRVSQVSQHFDSIEFIAQHREFITHTGYIGKKRISVISTGIGPDNIDIVFNELDALVNIDFATRAIKEHKTSINIIRLGTCGGLQTDAPPDSIIVSSHGIGLDNLLHYYNYMPTEAENHLLESFCLHTGIGSECKIAPYLVEAPGNLNEHFSNGFFHGITVTCPGFYGPQGRILRLPLALPNLVDDLISFRHGNQRITNFEMETSAMYGLAKLMGHKSLSVSVVVANRASRTFSKDGAWAVENMIEKTINIIANEIATAE